VDDGSKDGTAEWLLSLAQEGWLNLVFTPNIRFTRAVNEGLRWLREHVNPEWYLLLNSDTIVTPHWLETMLSTATRTGAAIVGCKLLLGSGLIAHAGAYGGGYHYGDHEPNCIYWGERLVPWVTGALMMLRKDCYFALGDFPPGPPGEQYDKSDRQYVFRAWKLGFMCAFSPAVVYHLTEAAMAMREEHDLR